MLERASDLSFMFQKSLSVANAFNNFSLGDMFMRDTRNPKGMSLVQGIVKNRDKASDLIVHWFLNQQNVSGNVMFKRNWCWLDYEEK